MLSLCPCQSGQDYAYCCRPYHQGKAAPTAEALMRSRYSAYVFNDYAYLHRTWHPEQRPSKASLQQPSAIEWQSLTILRTEQGKDTDTSGLVEFKAAYCMDGQVTVLHEISWFERLKGRWVYVRAL